MSRDTIEALRADYMPELPPIDAGAYLVAFLFEVGPVTQTGMGSAPLSFLEIKAWQDCTGIALTTFEARALRILSIAYANESYKATKLDSVAPWTAPDEKPQVLSEQVAFRALMNL